MERRKRHCDDLTATVVNAIRSTPSIQMIMVDKNSSNVDESARTIGNPYPHGAPTTVIDTLPQEIDGDGSITLAATVTPDTSINAGTTISTYSWTASPNIGSFTDASIEDAEWTAPAITNAAQPVTLTLTATDSYGASSSDSVVITVRANQAPSIDSLTASATTVNGGADVTLTATASDPENQSLTYLWASNGGGTFSDTAVLSPTWTAPATTASEQTVTLTLTVTDTVSATATDTVVITVRANQAPSIDSISGTPTTLNGSNDVTLTATASDPENQSLTYSWASNGGGTFADSSLASTTWTAPATTLNAQDITLTLTVTDSLAQLTLTQLM